MVKISFEDIRDIGIDKFSTQTNIDIDQQSGSTTRLELSTSDAMFLYEKLREKFE